MNKQQNINNITVKDLSSYLKVSHTTVYNTLNRLEKITDKETFKNYVVLIKNVKHITPAGQEAIRKMLLGEEPEEIETEKKEQQPEIIKELLEDQIYFLKEQINRKDQLIKEQSDTIRELSERMKELNYIKALEQKEDPEPAAADPKEKQPDESDTIRETVTEDKPTLKKGFIRHLIDYFKD